MQYNAVGKKDIHTKLFVGRLHGTRSLRITGYIWDVW
jgi:hypothetical protein